MKKNSLIALNLAHLAFSLSLSIAFSVNISLLMVLYGLETITFYINKIGKSNEALYFIYELTRTLKEQVNFIEYAPAIGIVILMFFVGFKISQDESSNIEPNNNGKHKKYADGIKNDIKNELHFHGNIFFAQKTTLVKRRNITISLVDLKKILGNEKTVKFKLHHEIYHIMCLDDVLPPVHELIINKIFLNFSVLLLSCIVSVSIDENFSYFYPKILNFLILTIIFYFLNKIVKQLKYPYRNIRECAADFYAYKKTNFIYPFNPNENIHLTNNERSRCCSGYINNIWIYKSIIRILFVTFVFFNPFAYRNMLISLTAYLVLFFSGLCCFLFVSVSNIHNKILMYLLIFICLILILNSKVLIINNFCSYFNFFSCEPYEIY